MDGDRRRSLPSRQIHLDFHTSPLIPDVAADWDAEVFASTMAAAHVQSVNLFATCHHGLAYYPSSVVPVHPSLGIDLLGSQIDALRNRGIGTTIYVTVGWNVSAAERHPEWMQVRLDGTLVRPPATSAPWASWPMMCLSGGYADELEAVVGELLDRYPTDGFWFDIVRYDPDGCACHVCLPRLREFAAAAGTSIEDPATRLRFHDSVARRWMRRMSAFVRSRRPDAGIFYNSRWGMHLVDELDAYTHLDIESLPTGDWGYGFFPLWSRFARTLGAPMVGMTGRFALSWADWGGLKHPDALRYDAAQMLAVGAAVSVGDQLPSRGLPEPSVYEVIGETFAAVEIAEPYCVGAMAVVETAVLVQHPERRPRGRAAGTDHLDGCARMLLELHHDFDVVTADTIGTRRYDLIVVPDVGPCDEATASLLRAHLDRGGAVLFSDDALTGRDGEIVIGDAAGLRRLGRTTTSPDFYRVCDERLADRAVRLGFPYSHYRGGVRVEAAAGTEVLAWAVPSHFDRTAEHYSSHFITAPLGGPDAEAARSPAITVCDRVAYVHGPVFGVHERFGHVHHRQLIGRLIDLVVPTPLVRTDAPATATVTVTSQPGRLVVHVVNLHAQRRTPRWTESLAEPVPLRDLSLAIRIGEAVHSVRTVYADQTLDHRAADGYVTVTVPRVDVHELVVFDLAAHLGPDIEADR
jgi:hypothetical protein